MQIGGEAKPRLKLAKRAGLCHEDEKAKPHPSQKALRMGHPQRQCRKNAAIKQKALEWKSSAREFR